MFLLIRFLNGRQQQTQQMQKGLTFTLAAPLQKSDSQLFGFQADVAATHKKYNYLINIIYYCRLTSPLKTQKLEIRKCLCPICPPVAN